MRLFDLHCDTLTECYRRGESLCRNDRHIDLKRGGRYRPWYQTFAVFVPDTVRGAAATRYARRVIEYAYAQEKRLAQQLVFVDRELTILDGTNRCGGILTIENGAAFGGRLENVARFEALGVRAVTLTWNGSNELGHGCLSGCDDGLTAFGRGAVRELVRLGIVPDVSHLNEAGFWDVATLIDSPFTAGHSLSRTVCDHPRNLTDAQFKEVRRRGGLVGLSLVGSHLGEPTFEAFERHLTHFLELGGETTVALGGDLDGTELPDEWGGIAVYERLYEYLLGRGLSERLLDRLFFQNAFDFHAKALQASKNEVQ